MPRYKLTIEYDGTPFKGWQWQDDQLTVQGVLQAAATALNGEPCQVYGAGRTDSGVHALGQAAHIDLIKEIRPDKVRDALNFHLGDHPVSILDAKRVDDMFHARFDALQRRYLYRVIDRRPKLALELGRVWRIPQKLDADNMHTASQIFNGQHDFSTFRDTQCQAKSAVKTIQAISVIRAADEIHISLLARSFLHKQVRSIVGTLVEVGRGHWSGKDVEAALKAKDRTVCGPVAPASGLYLVSVKYEI